MRDSERQIKAGPLTSQTVRFFRQIEYSFFGGFLVYCGGVVGEL